MSETDKSREYEFAERTQDHLNYYIMIADRKASILLTGHLTFLGLYANLINSNLESFTDCGKFLIIITTLLTLIAGGLALSVVFPRKFETNKGNMLWASIVTRSKKEYQEDIKNQNEGEILAELIDVNYALANVADRKYKHFKYSSYATIGMVASAILSFTLVII